MPSFSTKIFHAIIAALMLFAGAARAEVELGIDVLQKMDYAPLRGKRVGLVTNQTGVNSNGVRTRVLLAHAAGLKLVALFTPEHGLDGTEEAGKYVASRRDRVTGLPAYSLYGPTRKPTPEMLRGIDVLVYDMQDIGSRSYTYISTMVKCMEAAGENNIEFMVLDRPNPLGGLRVEGPPIEQQWMSFVGPLPVPYIHGMTAGELAKMANSLGWTAKRCNLSVIAMQGWQRQMIWQDTGLRWVATSPNIPHADSPFYYISTGLVGELAGLEIGCGGPQPFQLIATKWLDSRSYTSYLRSLNTPGVSFSAYSNGPFQGSRIVIDPRTTTNLCALGVYMLAGLDRGTNIFEASRGDKLQMFYKCYGSDSIRAQIERGVPVSRIVAGWTPGIEHFENARKPYLLY
ncbi:MAG TPA: DUF1343 domain-containing protein [Chthoniobacteraceae bacterium]|nr:DUF1343 domain-containing protein [Chthoniobacteraceae bacterium]